MKTKRLLTLLLAGAMTTVMLAGCGSNQKAPAASSGAASDAAASDLAKIQEAGELKIGYTVYEPMNYTDENGEFTGFDTEFARAVCEKLGVEPNFIEIVWDTKTVELESGNIDCIWNGMTITEELQKNTSISDPYVNNTQVVVTTTENKDLYSDFANLKGKTVALEAGSAAQALAEEDENLKDNIVTVSKQTDALLEVKSGTAAAAIFDQTMANTILGKGDYADLAVCGVFNEEKYGVAFRKGSDITAAFNEAMAELKKDGTLESLADKYGLNLA